MRERPSLHALEVFLAVVRHETMTAAAEAEGIAQPAISAHVRKLEAHFGVPLMERSGRRVRPTEAGRLVADYTRRLLEAVDELTGAIEELDTLRAGHLLIGASATSAETWLPSILGQFQLIHPRVRVDVRIGNSARVLDDVRTRRLSLGIVGTDLHDPLIISEPIHDDDLVLFTSADNPLLTSPHLGTGCLQSAQFVIREAGSATREATLRCMVEANLAGAQRVELGSNEAVKRAVAAGPAIGVLSNQTLDVDLRAGDLAILPVEGWQCRRQFWLIHREDRVLSAADRAFADMVRAKRAPPT
jgi:DNA-binding transcriptional LysR family regulator